HHAVSRGRQKFTADQDLRLGCLTRLRLPLWRPATPGVTRRPSRSSSSRSPARITSLAELYLPDATRCSINSPSLGGNEMFSEMRIAMLASQLGDDQPNTINATWHNPCTTCAFN